MSDRSVHSIRIAAMSDSHIRTSSILQPQALAGIDDIADVLVVAGDITDSGRIPEVQMAADVLAEVPVPVFAVLGNHDRRGLRRMAMRKILREAGVILLDGEFQLVDLANGSSLAIAGITGTGGGFGGNGVEPGHARRLTRALMAKSRREAARLDRVLEDMDGANADVSIVLTHFAPTVATLGDEPTLKYWMLGNALLGKVVDDHRIDLAVHGHAHLGSPVGTTPGGTPVRNVAVPDLGHIVVYHVGPGQQVELAVGPLPGLVETSLEPVVPDALAEPDLAR